MKAVRIESSLKCRSVQDSNESALASKNMAVCKIICYSQPVLTKSKFVIKCVPCAKFSRKEQYWSK